MNIAKLTNNRINSYFQDLNFVFDENYGSKNIAIFDKSKILVGKYEILGYYKDNWEWAFENKYIEKYLTNISKELSKKITFNKNLQNFLDECLKLSNTIWILKNNYEYKKLCNYLIYNAFNGIY